MGNYLRTQNPTGQVTQLVTANGSETVISESLPGGSPPLPATSHLVYVSVLYGNDTTGDGSQAFPFATIAKAQSIVVAPSLLDQWVINILPGRYVENVVLGCFTHLLGVDPSKFDNFPLTEINGNLTMGASFTAIPASGNVTNIQIGGDVTIDYAGVGTTAAEISFANCSFFGNVTMIGGSGRTHFFESVMVGGGDVTLTGGVARWFNTSGRSSTAHLIVNGIAGFPTQLETFGGAWAGDLQASQNAITDQTVTCDLHGFAVGSVAITVAGTQVPIINGLEPWPLIVTAPGAIDGDVLRLQGSTAGAYVLAQADSTLDAAGAIGVKVGAFCVPFTQCPIVNFDSAPIVGSPCFLSATVPGQLTSTAPGAGAISVPLGLIVQKVTHGGPAYAAQVAESGSIASSLSIDQQFVADAASEIGVVASSLHYESLDFNSLPTTGLPTFGTFPIVIAPAPTHFSTTPPKSRISFAGNDGGSGYGQWEVKLATPAEPKELNLLSNTSLANQQWSFRIKFRQTVLNNTIKFWLDKGAGNETVGFAMVTVAAVNSFYAMYGNFNPATTDPSAGQRVLLTPEDIVDHVVTMTSVNDGSIRFHFDAQPVHVLPLPASVSATIPRFDCVSTVMEIDYWQLTAP